jgi:purine nucleosidase
MVCELAGRTDVKVFAGAGRPLVRQLVTAEYVHGKTGLNGPVLPDPAMPLQAQHAVDFIVETLRARPAGEVTLCPLGPLTNIALALIRAPDIAPKVREIVLMGGGFFEGGNVTPSAEFNFYVDPHAAKVVFDAGIPLTVFALDLTHQVLTRSARVERIRALGTRVAVAVAEMMDFFERYDERRYGTDGGPLHDPNVIAWLLEPAIYRGRDVFVDIETGSELTMGASVVDWWGRTGRKPNAHYLREVDSDRFFDLLTERLSRLTG